MKATAKKTAPRRAAKPRARKAPAPAAADYVLPAGHVLVLRTCAALAQAEAEDAMAEEDRACGVVS